MAYDRTERFPKLKTQTPPDIGPGTYDANDVTCPPKHLGDFYPFLCGAKRKAFGVSRDAERFPGPGSYNVKGLPRHIPERVSIDFTDARFKEKIHEGPGPADYDVSEDVVQECPKKRTHPGTWRGPPGKLWLSHPPRSILPSAVSVPAKQDGGYTVDEYGVLIKNPPIKYESTLFFNIPRGETNHATLLYKGNFWSRMTGRTEPPPSMTPGPGDYEHETKQTAAQIRDEQIREAKRGTSRQLRFLDSLYRRKMLENFPAPNSYHVKGSFDRFFKIPCKCDPYAIEPPPFGQTSKRFDDKTQTDVPGPGTYQSQNRVKCVASILPAPFGSYATRFRRTVEDSGPAPSDYHTNVGNLAYESRKKFKESYVQTTDHTFFRKMFLVDDDYEDYEDTDFTKKEEEKKCPVYHAAFKSTTDRFSNPDNEDNPGPGAYEDVRAFKVIRGKCDFRRRRLAPPFGSSGSRLAKGPRIEEILRPDPTSYHVATDISKNVKGGVMPYSREKEKHPEIPGPTHYCMHPYVASSVLKKSFNATLGKPKIITDLAKQEERRKKQHCPCDRKKLRWFTVDTEKYKHCDPPCVFI